MMREERKYIDQKNHIQKGDTVKDFNILIKKIGEELGINVTLLSDNWTIVLEKNNETHYITGYQFDTNNHAIGNILDDKGLFYDLLKYKDIPIIEQYVIFRNYNKQDVLNYFNNHNNEIVIKANISNAGKEVFKVTNENYLLKIIDKLLLSQYSISLCPYYNIKNEYRVVVLNNEVRLIFGKVKPFIIGNGKNTVLELACEYNDYYVNHSERIENKDYIPKQGEKIELSFKFNLSSGAKTFTKIEDNLKKKITDLALRVTNELNITFASVDIVLVDNELLVMEANSGVTLNNYAKQNVNGYNIAYNIYKDAIKLMFNKS